MSLRVFICSLSDCKTIIVSFYTSQLSKFQWNKIHKVHTHTSSPAKAVCSLQVVKACKLNTNYWKQ